MRHGNRISFKINRPLDHIREVSFNAETITQFFAQVLALFQFKNIKDDYHIVKLDKTGCTSGWDINGTGREWLVTVAAHRGTSLRVSFRYRTRIYLLKPIIADGSSVLPAIVFQGQREPTLSDFGPVKKVSDVVEKSWKKY